MFAFLTHRQSYRKVYQELTSPDTDGAEYLYGKQTRELEPLNLQECYPQKINTTTTKTKGN